MTRSKLLLMMGAPVIVLAVWRSSVPALETSAKAVESFDRKMNKLIEAHKRGVPEQVRISEMELNSSLEDWYHRKRIDLGWPPWGTTFYFRGGRAGACVPSRFRIVVVDAKLVYRANGLYPQSSTVWFGIVPVPGSVVAYTAKRFFKTGGPPKWDDPLLVLPDYVTSGRIEGGELVLETR